MMVNPGVHGYTKTTNQGKYSDKRKKSTMYQKLIKRMLKPKYKLSGVVILSWPGKSNCPFSLPSITPLHETL